MIELLCGLGIICGYYAVLAAIAIALRFLVKIPDEIFRKMLHFILLGSFPIFVFYFDTWWISVIAALGFAAVVYPILILFERLRSYSEVVTERRRGELKSSLLVVFSMFATVITVTVGLMGDRYAALASVLSWGIGDAFAALIGKRFGKHKLEWRGLDGKKSLEGNMAMFICSFVSVLAVLLLRGGISVAGYIVIPTVTALVSSAVELYSGGGNDTFFCPTAAMAVLVPLIYLFGGAI